jgi:hypothetical protein
MSATPTSSVPAWRDSYVWSRTLRIGLPVGLAQVCINQGDHWIAGAVTVGVVLKSLLSPTLSCGIAFISAASTRNSLSSSQRP